MFSCNGCSDSISKLFFRIITRCLKSIMMQETIKLGRTISGLHWFCFLSFLFSVFFGHSALAWLRRYKFSNLFVYSKRETLQLCLVKERISFPLSQKWHPDKHKGDDAATAKFQEINEAYTGNFTCYFFGRSLA